VNHTPSQRELDDLVLRLKGLVHVRALLEARGATDRELQEHTDEIARVRTQLADVSKEASASYGAAA
jgi:vacuolar-type H+-ATPase subunit D/Vma8